MPRCPNGTRKNKKTGNCESKASSASKTRSISRSRSRSRSRSLSPKMHVVDLSSYEITEDEFFKLPFRTREAISPLYFIATDNITDTYNLRDTKKKKKWYIKYGKLVFILSYSEEASEGGPRLLRLECSRGNATQIRKFIKSNQINDAAKKMKIPN